MERYFLFNASNIYKVQSHLYIEYDLKKRKARLIGIGDKLPYFIKNHETYIEINKTAFNIILRQSGMQEYIDEPTTMKERIIAAF